MSQSGKPNQKPSPTPSQIVEQNRKRLEELTKPSPAFKKLYDQFEKAATPSPAAKKILDQVEEQRKRLETLSGHYLGKKLVEGQTRANDPNPILVSPKPFELPELKNPVWETNEKLADIEKQFERLLNVMTNAAQIGNDIQAQATTFIDKFEEASGKTDKSAKQAIKVGYIALFISVVTLLSPWVQSLIWPNTVEQKIERLTGEIITSRDTMAKGNNELLKVLSNANEQRYQPLVEEIKKGQKETNAVLRELIMTLKDQQETIKN